MSNKFLVTYTSGEQTKVLSDCEDAAALANQMFGKTMEEMVEFNASVELIGPSDDLWDDLDTVPGETTESMPGEDVTASLTGAESVTDVGVVTLSDPEPEPEPEPEPSAKHRKSKSR